MGVPKKKENTNPMFPDGSAVDNACNTQNDLWKAWIDEAPIEKKLSQWHSIIADKGLIEDIADAIRQLLKGEIKG